MKTTKYIFLKWFVKTGFGLRAHVLQSRFSSLAGTQGYHLNKIEKTKK